MKTETFIINKWYRKFAKTPVHEQRMIMVDGEQALQQIRIWMKPCYMRLTKNLRSPQPQWEYLTEESYNTQWVEECMRLLNQDSLEDYVNPKEVSTIAADLYEHYGQHECVTPQKAIDERFGLHETKWVAETVKQLESRANSKEYKEIGDAVGDTVQEQAEYLYSQYGRTMKPVEAVMRYFALAIRAREANIEEAVVITLNMPSYIKTSLDVTSIQIVAKSVNYKDGSKRLLVSYEENEDDPISVLKVMDEWRALTHDKRIPAGAYKSTGLIEGINGFSKVQESRELVGVYPIAASSSQFEIVCD
jgi:hypothetical protein